MTNILTSHTGKQLLGAVAGMAIAGLLYVGIDQTSNIKGLLVSTRTITVTPESNINAKDADDATLRRIATRAQTVAATLEKESVEAQAETPLTNHASSRRTARQFTVQLQDVASNAKTYANDPNVVISEKDRLAIRAARIAGLPDPAVAPQPTTNTSSSAVSEVSAAPGIVTVSDAEPMHQGAQQTQPVMQATDLPNSGLGLNLLVLITLTAAFVSSNTSWRNKLASLMQGVQIG